MAWPYKKAIGVPKVISPKRWPLRSSSLGRGKLGINLSQAGAATPLTFQQTLDFLRFRGDAYSKRGSGLTGAVDSRYISGILRLSPPSSTNGSAMEIVRSSGPRFRIVRSSDNKLTFIFTNGVSTLQGVSSFTFKVADADRLIMFCLDTNRAAGSKIFRLWSDGVEDTPVITDTGVAFTGDMTEVDWAIGATTAGASKFNGMISAIWIDANNTAIVDWSDPATMAKAYANGEVQNLGTDGSAVTGRVPIIYQRILKSEGRSAFWVNRGSGGNFSPVSETTFGAKAGKKTAAMQGWGDSIMDGTAASVQPFKCERFLIAQALGRTDINGGWGGQPLRDFGAAATTSIVQRFCAWLPGPGQAATNTFALDEDYLDRGTGFLDMPYSILRAEGGYNDAAAAINVADLVTSAQLIKTTWTNRTNNPYWFVGVPNGGQLNSVGAEVDEEYGSGGTKFLRIASFNTALLGVFGSLFYDSLAAQITNARDPTPQSDTYPLGSLKIAEALGYDVTTHGDAGTGFDSYDIAHGVVPSSLRSLTKPTLIPSGSRRTGAATWTDVVGVNDNKAGYGIHPNDAGHAVRAILELRFLASIGITALAS